MSTGHLHLEVRDLTVSYQGVPAIHHIGLNLHGGHCVGLFGPNGAGKTTLLKAIAGLVACETGTVAIDGCERHPGQAHRHPIRHQLCYLPQRETVDWQFPITVRGLAEMGRYTLTGWWRAFSREDDAKVSRALEVLGLEDLEERQISELSGGQQQRAFLARALAQESEVLLLDEPFTGLDRNAQEGLSRLMKSLAAEGRLLIVSHHDLLTAREYFDRAILLNGELLAEGPVGEVLSEINITKAFQTKVYTGEHLHHGHGGAA